VPTVSFSVGVVVPIPIVPLLVITNALMVLVVKFVGEDVAIYKEPMIERNVHAFEVALPSESASCGAVDDAILSDQRGDVVPRPTSVSMFPLG
jgi:hypothetical protein